MYVDIDVDHGPSYGETLFWDAGREGSTVRATRHRAVRRRYEEALRPLHQAHDATGEDAYSEGQKEQTQNDDNERSGMGISRRGFVAGAAAGLVAASLTGAAPGQESSATSGKRTQGSGRRRVIIDTDPGVDDALALLLAMRSPELKIEAITPVAGNVPLGIDAAQRASHGRDRGTNRYSGRCGSESAAHATPGDRTVCAWRKRTWAERFSRAENQARR